jgi:hypothetical protein
MRSNLSRQILPFCEILLLALARFPYPSIYPSLSLPPPPPRPRGERGKTVHGFYEGPESSIGGQLSAKQTGPRGKV